MAQTQDELQLLEQKLLDAKTVSVLPFEFYNYIAQVISNPNTIDSVKPPPEAENFFKNNKKNEAVKLFHYLVDQNISTNPKSFLESYKDLMLLRFRTSFQQNVKYSLRRIQTTEEYGLYNSLKVPNIPARHYFTFDVDEYVPKKDNGEIDFELLKKKEAVESNFGAFFSMTTTLYNLSSFIQMYFNDLTTRGLFPVVYRKELSSLILDVSDELLLYFSRLVYKSLTQGAALKDILANLNDYYSKSVNPERFKFSADLEQLQEVISEILISGISKFTELSKNSKESIYYELIESILVMIQSGLTIPEYYYKVVLREANKLDVSDYNVRYAVDLYILDPNGEADKNVYETYGFVIDKLKLRQIIKETVGNERVYKNFIKRAK